MLKLPDLFARHAGRHTGQAVNSLASGSASPGAEAGTLDRPRIVSRASWPWSATADPWVWSIAILVGAVHLATAGRYDAFRNELYFIVCGRHPAFGYVDQPPLVPLLAAATQVLGDHVWLLRVPAVLAAVALVPLTAAFARLLGGGAAAARIAAVAAGIAPGLMALTSTLTTSTFEPIVWTACAFLLARAAILEDRHALVWAGLVSGVAMEAKYGIAIWLIAMALAVILTQARRMLAWKELWLGIAATTVMALPSLLWQALHGWPFLEVILGHLGAQEPFTGTLPQFEARQAMSMNLLLAPLWITGVIAPFVDAKLGGARFLSLGFLVATAIVFVARGTNYYLFPAYPTMFAAGAVACAALGRQLVTLWLSTAAAWSAVLAPIVMPILDPPALAAYLGFTHLAPRPIEAAGVGAPLTQVFSDELGWRDLERKVADVYRSLPDEERRRAALLAANYGEASALDVYGGSDELPPALSGHNQYFLWGTRGYHGDVIINVNGNVERWRPLCRSVEIVGKMGSAYVMPYESDRPIFVCRGLRYDLSDIWHRFRRYK